MRSKDTNSEVTSCRIARMSSGCGIHLNPVAIIWSTYVSITNQCTGVQQVMGGSWSEPSQVTSQGHTWASVLLILQWLSALSD